MCVAAGNPSGGNERARLRARDDWVGVSGTEPAIVGRKSSVNDGEPAIVGLEVSVPPPRRGSAAVANAVDHANHPR